MSQTYDPNPIDTSHVRLDDEIAELASRLAVNAHERWAERVEWGKLVPALATHREVSGS